MPCYLCHAGIVIHSVNIFFSLWVEGRSDAALFRYHSSDSVLLRGVNKYSNINCN